MVFEFFLTTAEAKALRAKRMTQGVKVSRRQYAVGRFALCSLLLPTIVSAVKFFNKINHLHLHRPCACPARRSAAFPLITLRAELLSGSSSSSPSLMVRVPHDSTELAEVHDPEHGRRVRGFDQAGLRGLHHP